MWSHLWRPANPLSPRHNSNPIAPSAYCRMQHKPGAFTWDALKSTFPRRNSNPIATSVGCSLNQLPEVVNTWWWHPLWFTAHPATCLSHAWHAPRTWLHTYTAYVTQWRGPRRAPIGHWPMPCGRAVYVGDRSGRGHRCPPPVAGQWNGSGLRSPALLRCDWSRSGSAPPTCTVIGRSVYWYTFLLLFPTVKTRLQGTCIEVSQNANLMGRN